MVRAQPRRASTTSPIVCGASFAGLACAQACAARGLRTIVWERKRDAGEKVFGLFRELDVPAPHGNEVQPHAGARLHREPHVLERAEVWHQPNILKVAGDAVVDALQR